MHYEHIHTIYVPPGREAVDVWKELCIFGRMVSPHTEGGTWANVGCNGEECRLIEREAS